MPWRLRAYLVTTDIKRSLPITVSICFTVDYQCLWLLIYCNIKSNFILTTLLLLFKIIPNFRLHLSQTRSSDQSPSLHSGSGKDLLEDRFKA